MTDMIDRYSGGPSFIQSVEISACTVEDYPMKCGEILLMKNEWCIHFKCAFCNKELRKLTTFLRHTLLDHMSLTKTEITALLQTLTTSKEDSDEELFEEIPETKKEIPSCGEDIVDIELQLSDSPNKYVDIDMIADYDYNCDEIMLKDEIEELVDEPKQTDECDEIIERIEDEDGGNDDDTTKSSQDIEFVSVPDSSKIIVEKNINLKQIIAEARARKEQLMEQTVCEYCAKTFRNAKEYEKHKKKHIKSHICDICNAAFADISNMKVHRNRHLGIKPFGCEFCDKTFATTTEVKFHTRSHTGERPYVCSECNSSYTCSADLKGHQRRHRNERPFVCAQCGKAFFDAKHLRDHELGHSDFRPHKCHICNTDFTRRKALIQHMKLHSSVKEYICVICLKEFAQSAGLHSHMKRHHTKKEIRFGQEMENS